MSGLDFLMSLAGGSAKTVDTPTQETITSPQALSPAPANAKANAAVDEAEAEHFAPAEIDPLTERIREALWPWWMKDPPAEDDLEGQWRMRLDCDSYYQSVVRQGRAAVEAGDDREASRLREIAKTIRHGYRVVIFRPFDPL